MLNKQWLKTELTKFYNKNRKDSTKAADEMADIIDEYIKSATVISNGKVIVPSGGIIVAGPSGPLTNAQPVIFTNVKNKGQIK